jgi:RimJ/RimL family protein N-acetyltransferase
VATIKTPRLLLRHWQDTDIEPWVAMNLDPRVMEFFPRPLPRDLALTQAETMRRKLDDLGYGWWVVEVPGVTPFAGVIALQEVPFEAHFTPAYEIGWRFAPEFWHRGFATEGARGALDYGFTTLGLNEIVALTAAINLPSRRVMERLGMTHDPAEDFDHPRVEKGNRVERHVVYRITAP